nr:loricrin-like [Malus domestica]
MGEFIAAAAGPIERPQSALHAEFIAARRAMLLARSQCPEEVKGMLVWGAGNDSNGGDSGGSGGSGACNGGANSGMWWFECRGDNGGSGGCCGYGGNCGYGGGGGNDGSDNSGSGDCGCGHSGGVVVVVMVVVAVWQ